MMNWLRWHHGTSSDPKWRVIAKAAGVSAGMVVSIWATMLENASENSSARGTLDGWDPENVAAGLDYDVEQVRRVFDVMEKRVRDGNRLTGWGKRNPLREREDDSTKRVQNHRNAKRNHETPSNAKKRPDKIDKIDRKYSDAFLRFWDLYPKAVGKGKAFESWEALSPSPELVEELLAAVATQKKSRDWTKDGGQFVPNPATWLNQRRWEDRTPDPPSPLFGRPKGVVL